MIYKFTKSLLCIMLFLTALTGFTQNLLTNGDFESGGNGVGFSINSSFYHQVVPSGNTVAGDYAVTNNPALMNGLFPASTDHSGTGNMLVVDGATTGGQYFWRAGSVGNGACGLTVGATYTFSYWIKSVSTTVTGPSTQAQIEIVWNNANNIVRTSTNATTGNSVYAPLPIAGWQLVSYTFVPTNACVNIEIKDNNVSGTGNDFAVDDFSLLAPPQPLSVKYSITNPTCPGANNGTIFAYGQGGTPAYIYSLSGAASVPNSPTGQFTGLAPGNYTVTVTDLVSGTASQNGIIIPNPPDLTLSATSTSICAGGSTTLSASGSTGTYTWTASPADPSLTAAQSPTVSPTVPTTYTATSTNVTPDNLVYNGDFFLGNNGFTSDYTYFTPNNPSGAQKAYGVVVSANSWEAGFGAACVDHTTGTGRMMVIDGSTANLGNDKVWCQTVPVTAGQNYTISYWVQTLALPNPANIEVHINGLSQGVAAAPNTTCGWVQRSYLWNAGVSTTAEICIYNRNTSLAGNDFAIDDITFARTNTCNLSKSISIAVVNSINLTVTNPSAVCSPSTVNITLPAVTAGSTAGTTLTYWTDAAATTGPLTLAQAQAIAVNGTYYIKSTLGGCSVIRSVLVSISASGSTPMPTVTSPVRYCVGSSPVAQLTAISAPGATLNWYGTDATGGTALPTAPTPSTAVAGNTVYYVSQTIGTCESPRRPLTVSVALLSYNFFCDPSQVTTNPVTSVYFDWQNVSNPPPVYNISYSINGGPVQTAATNISHYEVMGVLPGQSVTLTITSSNGYPCIPSQSYTCANCAVTTTPTFATIPTSICSGAAPPVLPTTSDNGISGTWSPATVSNTTGGTYAFTPNATLFPCATGPVNKGISVATPPNAGTLGGTQTVCVGSTTSFNSSTGGGNWSSGTPGIATVNAGNGTVTGVSPGTATITYTVNGTGGCTPATATRTVTVSAPTSPGTLGGSQTICIGQNTTFVPTVSGGSWSTSSATIASVVGGVITGNAAGTATITYTVSGTGGCPSVTTTRTVTVSAPPNAGTLTGTQGVCVGSTTTFFSPTSGGTWSSNNAAVASVNLSTGVITGVAAGTATIEYMVNGTGGCSNATATRTVTVSNPPSAGTLNGNQAICVGQNTTFIPLVAGGSWSSSSVAIATVSPGGLITGISAGTATITYMISGTGGCGNVTTTRTVTVSAVPNPGVLNGGQAICIGFSTTFGSSSPGGTWISSAPGIATINAAGDIIGVSAGTATMTYAVAGTGGCAGASATRTVTVTAPPSPGLLNGGQNICVGGNTTFSSTVPGGSWTSSDTTIATINSGSGLIIGITAGTATMTYTVSGTGGCSSTNATRTVTVSPNVLPTFTQVAPICNGEALAPLPTTSNNGITGTWNPPTMDNTLTKRYDFTPTFGLCALPTSMTIVVSQPVTPLFGLFAPLCQGATPPILPTSSSNTPPITGTWNAPVSTATLGTTTYTFTPTPGQCVVTTPPTTLAITVVPVLTPNFPPIAPFCEGKTAPVLSTTSPNGVEGTWNPAAISNTVPQSYTFTPNPDQCAVTQTLNVTLITRTLPDFAPIPAFCKGTPAPILATTSPNGITGVWSPAVIDNMVSGTFRYLFTPDEPTECALTQTLYITVIEPLFPGFFDFAICTGSIAPPLVNVSPNGVNGTWSPATIDNIFSGSYLFTPDPGECALSQAIDVTINQYTLTAIDGFVTNYFEDNQVVTVLATDAGNYLYQLDFGPLQQSNVFQNVGSGVHTIKVIDANGCSNPLTGEVLVINYPKFFTPQGDGYNDTWNIFGLKDQLDSKISIFDRQGKLLKQISPTGPGWDGTCNGQRMPSTDYWFIVEYTENGSKKEFKAHFSLKR